VTGGFSGASAAVAQSGRSTDVAAAGFGDAGAAAFAPGRRAISTAGGFGDAVAASSTPSRPQRAPPPDATAAQILEKPRPAYSEEARRMKIEGEVQLEVLFRASGQVDIVRVVRGLGHGLDENAAQAARTIRFLPARRDGRPVDSTATVHIIFQLAS
jgi:TonB family protein